MPIYQGTQYTRVFQLTSRLTNNPIDLTGWEFVSQIRVNTGDPDPPLLTLTSLPSPGENFFVTDPTNGYLQMIIYEDQTALLPAGVVNSDVMRFDTMWNGLTFLFSWRATVVQPVTRLS